MPLPPINPPLINSANPWATTEQDLKALFDCPHTGAVTTRTTLLHGFEHDDNIHQYTFFSSHNHSSSPPEAKNGSIPEDFDASLNTLGYSPIPLANYLAMIAKISSDSTAPHRQTKPWIISVTGSSDAVTECYHRISAAQTNTPNPLCMEINLSCPNIPDKPPPAYSRDSLAEYLGLLAQERSRQPSPVPVGIKTPPYTYHDQFQTLITALLDAGTSSASGCPIDFITATNTLGSSLLLSTSTNDDVGQPAINSASGQGIGGMAGAPLHPLALGNVKTIRSILDAHESLREVEVIGVGGVSDAAGAKRMRAVGASVVGVGTALGRDGLGVFEGIAKG